jgi:hypothetical protein
MEQHVGCDDPHLHRLAVDLLPLISAAVEVTAELVSVATA